MQLNKSKYKKINVKIFIILTSFTALLIFLFISVQTIFFSNQFEKISLNNAMIKIEEREEYLNKFLIKAKNSLISLRNSNTFDTFLNNRKNKIQINDLFLHTTTIDQNIMQLRFINKNGKESVRIERDNIQDKPHIVNNEDLQDKGKRNYFKKSKVMLQEKVWYSNLNLNIENGKIELPYKSTLRVILPIYTNGTFDGIIIVNYFMNMFLDSFMDDSLYETILIDKEGYPIIHFEKDKSWGKYQSPQINLFQNNKEFSQNILKESFIREKSIVSKRLNTPISNELILIMKLNEEYILEEKLNELSEKISISLIIFLISIILIFIITNIIKNVILDLICLNEYTKLINENVITSTTDVKGKIIYASEAFCKISGYSKEELLGQNHNIVRHQKEDKNKYKKLWNKLKINKPWEGELLNKSKQGKDYWVKAKIYPIFDNKKKKIGYTAIRQDITDKKKVEELSITNSLTQVYNRRYFDEMLPKIVNASKRNNTLLSYIMLDIDFFKLYNDTYGHQEGDNVLIEVSKVFKSLLKRSTDYCFRIGGEEFAIIINVSEKAEAIQFAEKIRISVENLKIKHSKNKVSDFVTVSIGLISVEGKEVKNTALLYKDADDLLYKAKESGRNKVIYNN